MKKSNAAAAATLPGGKKWTPRPPLESQIQQQCVRWFQMQHRRLWLDGMLFHIANEGVRPGAMGRRTRREGVVRGVADLCLALPRHGCGALYIEMKRPGSYQTPEQRAWQRAAEAHGNRYVVCRSLDEFIAAVDDYLAPDPAPTPAPTNRVCFRSELQLGLTPNPTPMTTNIPLSGFAAQPSDHDCPDGQLAAAINLINEDAALRPLPPPATAFSVPTPYKPLFIHRTPSYSHLVLADTSSSLLYWADISDIPDPQPDANGACPTHELLPADLAPLSSDTLNPTAVNALGNTLVIASPSAPIRYFLFKESAYIDIGSAPPFPSIAFGCYRIGNLCPSYPTITSAEVGNLSDYCHSLVDPDYSFMGRKSSSYSFEADKDLQDAIKQIGQAAMGCLLSETADNVTSKGYFYQPFFVRYAYRLYDGSYAWHSAPILLLNTMLLPCVFAEEFNADSHELTLRLNQPVFSLAHYIFPDGLDALPLWSDIIKGIDFFISAPIYTYDQSKIPERFMPIDRVAYNDPASPSSDSGDYVPEIGGMADGVHRSSRGGGTADSEPLFAGHYADENNGNATNYRPGDATSDPFGLNPGSFEDKLFSSTMYGNVIVNFSSGSNVMLSSYKMAAAFERNPNFLDEIRSAASGLFYKVAHIDIDELKASTKFTRLALDHDDLSALTSKPRLADDYRSHYGLCPRRLLNYNNRLHLADINVNIPGAFPLCSCLDFAGKSVTYSSLLADIQNLASPSDPSDPDDTSDYIADHLAASGLPTIGLTLFSRHDGLSYKATAHGSINAATAIAAATADRPAAIALANLRDVALYPPRYLFVPDPGAYRLVITAVYPAGHPRFPDGKSITLTLNLEPHDTLNGAYFFAGLGVLDEITDDTTLDSRAAADSDTAADSADTAADSSGPAATAVCSSSELQLGSPAAPGSSTVPEPNKIYLSDAANPFVFPASQIVSVGSGQVLAVTSAAQPLSEGQFGQFPLYALTSEGVWALELSSTGTYVARQPLAADVCSNPDAVTPTDNAVLFPSSRGLMAVAGRTVQCISDTLNNDYPFNPLALPAASQVLDAFNALPCPPGAFPPFGKAEPFPLLPFSSFLATARIVYDYAHQRVVLANSAAPYAYVYSLRSHLWGMALANIDAPLNAYPNAYAVTGIVDGNRRLVVDYAAPGPNAPTPALAVTRPIALGDPGVLKSIDALFARGDFPDGGVALALYGSRNLRDWGLVKSSRSHRLRSVVGSPFKAFRVVALASLAPTDSISSLDVSFSPRYNSRLR